MNKSAQRLKDLLAQPRTAWFDSDCEAWVLEHGQALLDHRDALASEILAKAFATAHWRPNHHGESPISVDMVGESKGVNSDS